jgi:hypothetical protein
VASTLYARIDRVICPRCGDKGAAMYNGRRYPLPCTVLSRVAENTRPRCECGQTCRLTVTPVEGE